MKKDDAQKKRDILDEVIGPTISYGKHSTYYKKGKKKIIIQTKKAAEELPEDVIINNGSRQVIFEDSRGNIRLSFEIYEENLRKPTKSKFDDSDWG